MATVSTIIAGIGLGVSAAGTVAGIAGQQAQASAQKKAIGAQERQADLEQGRQRRQVYRDMLKAQAMTEVAGAGSGALGSSAVGGGLAQAANSGAQSQRDINQNAELGAIGFSAQRQAAGAMGTANMLRDIGGGLTSLGGSSFIRSLPPLTKLGRA